jgi:hypothetical protein
MLAFFRGKPASVGAWRNRGFPPLTPWRSCLREASVTRVNLGNVLDEGLRIGGRERQMNSTVKDQTNKVKLDVY